ncbi:MAG: hypothetical protein ACRDH5_09460 [bacterium]
MTTPRTPLVPALLALGLAATVALPAATAVQIATSGNAALDAAWSADGSMGGGEYTCMSTDCGQGYVGGAYGSDGGLQADAGWDLQAEADEQAALDAAMQAVEQAKAEAEAKVQEASELKDRVRADVRADGDVETRGDADAAMDSDAPLGGTLGLDGLLTVNGDRRVDLQEETQVKHEAEAQVDAQADSAIDLLAGLLEDLQGQVTMAFTAAVAGAAEAGNAIAGALGLVQATQVDVHHSVDARVGLGAVPDIEVPRIGAPDVGLSGSGNLAAQASGALEGVIR